MVSIIVPVYNATKYLDVCFSSIEKQTYTEFEVIVVDDGSTDGSGDICDDWAKRDSRFRVFHKDNSGVADTRNYALRQVCGDQLCFVDSDDAIHRDFLAVLLQEMKNTGADIVMSNPCKANEIFDDDVKRPYRIQQHQIFEGPTLLREYTGNTQKYEYANWGKLFLSSIARDLRFGLYKVGEDRLFNYMYMKRCRCGAVVDTDQPLYIYRLTPGSLTDKKVFDVDRVLDCIYAQYEGICHIEDAKAVLNMRRELYQQLCMAISRGIRCGKRGQYVDAITRIKTFMGQNHITRRELLSIYANYSYKRKVVQWLDIYMPDAMFVYWFLKSSLKNWW